MDDIDAFLPLPPATFHILLALADEDRHGYAIIQDVEARTDGELRLSAGTLYRSIQRMLEQGLIVEPRERPVREDDDERRRYYRITPLGTSVAKAEARRVADVERQFAAMRRGEQAAWQRKHGVPPGDPSPVHLSDEDARFLLEREAELVAAGVPVGGAG